MFLSDVTICYQYAYIFYMLAVELKAWQETCYAENQKDLVFFLFF